MPGLFIMVCAVTMVVGLGCLIDAGRARAALPFEERRGVAVTRIALGVTFTALPVALVLVIFVLSWLTFVPGP